MKPIRVGLLGLGVVGGGTWKVLTQNADEITRRAGRGIEVVAVAARDMKKAQALLGEESSVFLTTDAMEVVRSPEVDVVVELVGVKP